MRFVHIGFTLDLSRVWTQGLDLASIQHAYTGYIKWNKGIFSDTLYLSIEHRVWKGYSSLKTRDGVMSHGIYNFEKKRNKFLEV